MEEIAAEGDRLPPEREPSQSFDGDGEGLRMAAHDGELLPPRLPLHWTSAGFILIPQCR